MQLKKLGWTATLLLLAAGLASCNIGKSPEPTTDVSAIYTSAAATTIAQLNAQQTQTAQAIPPTPLASPTALPSLTSLPTSPFGTSGTPFVFNTPNPLTPFASPVVGTPPPVGSSCNNSAFVADVTIADGTVMKPGNDFEKVWRIQNTGTCTWDDGYVLVYLGGSLDGHNVPIKEKKDFVEPGKTHDFGVDLTAPLTPNTYEDCWKMKDDHGFFFGTYLCVKIEVKK
jgi:hypothetical protein